MGKIHSEFEGDIDGIEAQESRSDKYTHTANAIRTLGFATAMSMKEKVQTLPQPAFEKALKAMAQTSLHTTVLLREEK